MSITKSWTPASPAGGDDPRQGDDVMRDMWTAIHERERNGGHIWETSASADTEAGRHACGVEQASGGTGSPLAGEFYVYAADGSTRILTLRDSTAADPSNFDVGSFPIRGKRIASVHIPLVTGATGRVSGVIFHNNSGATMTLTSAQLVCFTAPSASPLDVDMNVLASGYTDPTAAGTSIFGTHTTIAAGSRVGTAITSFNDATLAAGEAWVWDVDALNSASDIIMLLKVEVLR